MDAQLTPLASDVMGLAVALGAIETVLTVVTVAGLAMVGCAWAVLAAARHSRGYFQGGNLSASNLMPGGSRR